MIGKVIYIFIYGKFWSWSLKLVYILFNKLISKNEFLFKFGDRVVFVFLNSDFVMFMVVFYGCFLVELVFVFIEVLLMRKDVGS